jgi:hypothetical protein
MIPSTDSGELIVFTTEYIPDEGELYSPYYRKVGDIRCQVTCMHCKNRDRGHTGSAYRCGVSSAPCSNVWRFCDHHVLDPTLHYAMWQKGWRAFPAKGGWLQGTDYVPDTDIVKPQLPLVSPPPARLIEWIK